MKVTGAEALIRSLEKEEVEVIFGVPGGATLPIYDALANSRKITHYLTRHEQVAAHAADGYARATGKVGVCMATSGPGATNLVTGIANAYMDSIPIVAITGQVPRAVIGTDAFQEADTTGATLPIVKHSYLITDATQIPQVVKEAFYIARSGRPGPVLIDIPRDVSQQIMTYYHPENIDLPGYKPTYRGHARQIKEGVNLLLKAERPVFFIGGGIILSEASEEVKEIAELLELPVIYTLMGKGAFPDSHPLNLGMIGMHGTCTANHAIQNCDLIFAAGVRFDDRATGRLDKFAPLAKVVHIDIDPAEIGKNVPVDVPIVGDARIVLRQILEVLKIKIKEVGKPSYKAWQKKIAEWRKKYPLKYPQDNLLRPQYVVETISKLTRNRETIITTGVGQNQMWAAQYYKAEKPRRFLTSGGLGTMGYGFPAAIGAQVACPECLVVTIDGDGSFQMVLQDLATVKAYSLPVKVVILNNGYLGMVRQWQELFYKKKYMAVFLAEGTPDFVKLAEAYDLEGYLVERKSDLEPTLKKAFNSLKAAIVDVRVNQEENVFPMVPAGCALDEIIVEGEKK